MLTENKTLKEAVLLRDIGILDREHEIKERDMYIDHLEARFKELEDQII